MLVSGLTASTVDPMYEYGEPGDQYTPEGQIRQAGAFAHGLRERARRSRPFRLGLRIVACIAVLLVLAALTAP